MSEITEIADNGAASVDALVADTAAPLVTLTRGATQLIIFNRPEARNALTRDMRRAFAQALSEADADAGVRAVVLTGAGGTFCAGVDLKESRAAPAPMVRPHPGEALRSMRKPVIAAVDGACVTGGLEIALACSFIVASTQARFADTHGKVGLFPAWGLSVMLPGAIGARRARQMMLTGAFIDAERAFAWGLVNEIVAAAQVLTRCLELANAMSALDPSLTDGLEARLRAAEEWRSDAALDAEAIAAARWRNRDDQS